MDVAPTQAQAADDQELAKVLESMNSTLTTPPAGQVADGVGLVADPVDDNDDASAPSFTMPDMAPLAVDSAIVAPTTDDTSSMLKPAEEESEEPVAEAAPELEDAPEVMSREEAPSSNGSEFDSIKREALTELRPLIDKLDLSPEDKFNTILLIIRSTDDKELVPKAHEAAKSIDDESKRAAALLDIIKEIDYFSNPQK